MLKNLFSNHAQELQNDINKYLEVVTNSNMVFKRSCKNYLKDNIESFEDSLDEINKLENSADDFQKDIKYKLYKYMLIPEARGDVLALLENIDNIVDHIKKLLVQFSIERPTIPDSLNEDVSELVDMVSDSVDVLIKCIRAYFKNISMVNEYANKVHFYEHEADKIEESVKRKVFEDSNLEYFSQKTHLRYFVEQITEISDRAETISERASVAAIKRRI
ncbi:MAG TPA: DUF47 family protein [Halanaerobiales bacterium]|nr:DUF47 family protein [Halanaerobiales bacterium]